MKQTPHARINKYVTKKHIFETIPQFQAYVREHGTMDCMAIAGVLYTMEEYDNSGAQIIYQNRRNKHIVEVDTSNRYGLNGFKDAEAIDYEACSWREDINYLD